MMEQKNKSKNKNKIKNKYGNKNVCLGSSFSPG